MHAVPPLTPEPQVSGFLKRHMPLALAEALGEAPALTSADASFSSTAASSNRAGSKAGGGGKAGSGSANSSGSGGPADVAEALTATFLHLDGALRGEPDLSVQYSGSTAVVCMLQVGRAY